MTPRVAASPRVGRPVLVATIIVLLLISSAACAAGSTPSERHEDGAERAAAVGSAVDDAARPMGYRATLDAWPPADTTPPPQLQQPSLFERLGCTAFFESVGSACLAAANAVTRAAAYLTHGVCSLFECIARGVYAGGAAVCNVGWSHVVEPAVGVAVVPIKAAAAAFIALAQAVGGALEFAWGALAAVGRGIGRAVVAGGEAAGDAIIAVGDAVGSAAAFIARGVEAAAIGLWSGAICPVGEVIFNVVTALSGGLTHAFVSLWSGVCWVAERIADACSTVYDAITVRVVGPLAHAVAAAADAGYSRVLVPLADGVSAAVCATASALGDCAFAIVERMLTLAVILCEVFAYRAHCFSRVVFGVPASVLGQIFGAIRVGLIEPVVAFVSILINAVATLVDAVVQAVGSSLEAACNALAHFLATAVACFEATCTGIGSLCGAVGAEAGRRVLLLLDVLVGPFDLAVRALIFVADIAHAGCTELASHTVDGLHITHAAMKAATATVANSVLRPLCALAEPLLYAGTAMLRSTAHVGRCCAVAVAHDVAPFCCAVADRLIVTPLTSGARHCGVAFAAALNGFSRFVLHTVDVVVVAPAEAAWSNALSPLLLSAVDWLRPVDPLWRGGTGGPAMTRAVTRDGVQLYVLREDSDMTRPLYLPARQIHLPQEGEDDITPTVTLDSFHGKTRRGMMAQAWPIPAAAPVRLRLQAVFLPLNETAGGDVDRPVDFCMETYSRDVVDGDSRRVFLLATPQGTTSIRETTAATRLFPVDRQRRRRWLEGTRSTQAVGTAQNESAHEEAKARAKGRAVARHDFGPAFLGAKRFNAQLLLEVPTESDRIAASLRDDAAYRGFHLWAKTPCVLVLFAVVSLLLRCLWRASARQRLLVCTDAVIAIEAISGIMSQGDSQPDHDAAHAPNSQPDHAGCCEADDDASAVAAGEGTSAGATDFGGAARGPSPRWCVAVLGLLLLPWSFSLLDTRVYASEGEIMHAHASPAVVARHRHHRSFAQSHDSDDSLVTSSAAPVSTPSQDEAMIAHASRRVARRATHQRWLDRSGDRAGAMAETQPAATPAPTPPEKSSVVDTLALSMSESASSSSAPSPTVAASETRSEAAAEVADGDEEPAVPATAMHGRLRAGAVVPVSEANGHAPRRVHRVPRAHPVATQVPLPEGAATSRNALVASAVLGGALLGASSPLTLAAVAAFAIIGILPSSTLAAGNASVVPPPQTSAASVPAAARPLFLHQHAAVPGGLPPPPPRGNASAARISYGSPVRNDEGPRNVDFHRPWRPETQTRAATMTITLFFGVEGGVPSTSDVERAVDELRTMKEGAVKGSIAAPAPDFHDDSAFQNNTAPGWNRRRVDTLVACIAVLVLAGLVVCRLREVLGAKRAAFAASPS